MATFVLVHGAFGSPAELASVIPLLEALGHRAIAVDLPCWNPAATLDDYARTVVEAMAGAEGPVVVVGHSAGGATISLVPGRTRVDRLVYVTAVVPEPGRSTIDVVGAGVRETLLSVSRDDGNGCRSFDLEMLASLAPPEEREAYRAFLAATQRPQGWAALEQPWPGQALPDVPRTYVLCTEDNVIPPAQQREMAARLGVEPIEIAAEHSVFALQPRELVAAIAATDQRELPGFGSSNTARGMTIDFERSDGEEALSLIRQLDEDLCRRYPAMPPQMIHGLHPSDLADPQFTFLVVRIDGRGVGCGALRNLEPGVGEVKRMFVLPDFRGCGIGRRLLAALESRALELGHNTVRLETGKGQPEAIGLYRSSGYREIAAFGEYVEDEFSVCFEKRLT